MVDTIQALWRFPVKSMQGESLHQVTLGERGFPGDRAYGVLDVATGTIASAKQVKRFAGLMACRAWFAQPPRVDRPAPAVVMELPNGRRVRSDDAAVDRVLSAYFERELRLVRAGPDMYTHDQYRADADTTLAALPGTAGMGAFRDAHVVSVLTTATLARLGELQPHSRFDARRFRMNIIIDTTAEGFVDNDWLGHELGLGAGVRLQVIQRDGRCVMTTLPQADLPHDAAILKTIARHNRIDVDGRGRRACAGVYATVRASGTLCTGDRVTLA